MLREYSRQLDRTWVITDVGLCVALFVALAYQPSLTRAGGLHTLGPIAIAGMGLLTGLTWQIILSRFGVYHSHRRDGLLSMTSGLLGANAAGTLLLAATCFTLGIPVTPVFPLALGASVLLAQVALRVPITLMLRVMRRRGHNFRNVVIVGTGTRAREANDAIEGHPEWGQRVIAYLDDSDVGMDPGVPSEKVHKFVDLPSLLRGRTVDELLVACPRSMLEQINPVVHECAMVGVPVTLLTDFFGDELPAPRVGAFDSVKTLCYAPVHHNHLELIVKRGIDIVGALVGISVSVIPVGISAALIRMNSNGPIFFRQVRVGLNGRRFEMLKLRTMSVDAESTKHELMHLNEMDGPVFKVTNDPRITRVGAVLRRFSIDELPQFWNVLKGQMSLVGPRPPTPEEVGHYEGATRRRLSMRPGLTCYWQVGGRSDISFSEWVRLDLLYIDNWSLLTDVAILIRTIPEVLLGRGAR